nr:hypothetical protein GCM10020063_089640 [Dactylosporangium thailandense]
MHDRVEARREGVDGRQRLGDIRLHQGELGVLLQVRDVVLTPREEVVDNDDLGPSGDQGIREVGPDKPGSTGQKDAVTLAVTLRNDHDRQPSVSRRGARGLGGAPGPGTLR